MKVNLYANLLKRNRKKRLPSIEFLIALEIGQTSEPERWTCHRIFEIFKCTTLYLRLKLKTECANMLTQRNPTKPNKTTIYTFNYYHHIFLYIFHRFNDNNNIHIFYIKLHSMFVGLHFTSFVLTISATFIRWMMNVDWMNFEWDMICSAFGVQ